MRTARVSFALGFVIVLAACAAQVAGPDAGDPLDAGGSLPSDAGAGLEPLALEFVPYTPPPRRQHAGLVSDGTTVYDGSGSAIEASTDVGRTWQTRGARSGQVALVGSSTVYVLGQTVLSRSDDGAQTFTDLPLPAAATGTAPLLATTADGTVWLTLQAAQPALYRSTDRGASFQQVPLPQGTTVVRTCPSSHGTFVALRNAAEVMRFDGAGLVSLGPVSNPTFCLVTRTGTVLVSARDQAPFQLRIPAGSATPERQALRGATAYLVHGTDVVRTLTDGSAERSNDDGVTWTNQVRAPVNGFAIDAAVAAGASLLASSTWGLVELAPGASAWTLVEDLGLPTFLRVVDLSMAQRSAARALLLDDNTQRTLFVSPNGLSWTRGATLSPAEARAIAVSPMGDKVLVAGSFGGWRMLGADGKTPLSMGTLTDGAGRTETNPIQQASWDGDGSGLVVVTTANDVDSAGEVLSLDPAAPLAYWSFHTPASTNLQASWRPGGYHALALSPGGGTLNRRLFTSYRSLVSANGWSTSQLVWNRAFESQGFWEEYEGPVPAAALSASYSTTGTGPLALLFSEGRLRVGNTLLGMREVPTDNRLANARVVRFASDGRLWVGGPSGLFSTREPVVVP